MPFTVIAISRTLGAGGEDLGEMLADKLGFRYVDGEIIDRAAALSHVNAAEIAVVEKRKGLLGRILENMAMASGGSVAASGMPEPVMLEAFGPGYEQVIIDVIRETADMGAVVIVAHGASIPLSGREDVLRIMVTASEDSRAKRIALNEDVAPAKALSMIHESDKARADYFRRFYHLGHELPTNYDLLINTDTLDVSHAAAAVLGVVGIAGD